MHLSIDELFGNVFLEAMATGLPVVEYEYHRTRWIVGDEAFFADRKDPVSLPSKISLALQADSTAKHARTHRAHGFGSRAIAAQ